MMTIKSVEAVELVLHGMRVGVVLHHASQKNELVFDPSHQALPPFARPTLTLAQLVSDSYLSSRQSTNQRLAPVLSNLLPEGTMRAWLSQVLKVDVNNEFAMLAYTGAELPGGIIARPLNAGEIPAWALGESQLSSTPIDVQTPPQAQNTLGFSLAGVQIKFSGGRISGRFDLGAERGDETWIIKTPSSLHKYVPENEYTAMKLAQAIGVEIPEIALVPLNVIDNLPDMQLPNEPYAYVIKRFDRMVGSARVHSEDFAQIMGVFAHDKYQKANYEQIAALLNKYSDRGLADAQQMARRLLANILLANGDAHLKNWSVIYPDKILPVLSPAYDIVTTKVYMRDEQEIALNLYKTKDWYKLSLSHFEGWAKRVGLPWAAINAHLKDAIAQARDLWPVMLNDLPMYEPHKAILRDHWSKLSDDLKI